ncbi:MAG TPA: metallophosphoesterase family protein [Myxococcales bacterium]|nr:metallophosphoesterase family protein [Myxococcales bacterium]
MSLKAWGGTLALLLVAQGCDKLRSLPGLEPAPVVPAPPPPQVSMGPWLLDPLPGQLTVAWTTLEPSVGRVWYGTPEPDRLATEEGPASTDHRVVLPSLPPGTQVRYRVDGGAETGWFTSPPKQGGEGPIQVLVYGDNRTNNGDHALVARAAAAEHPQLALHTGDMVVSAREEPLWRVWFQEEHDLVAHAPILATVGDHEITDNGAAHMRFFQQRGRRAYWSVDYGPVHIVVLDSFETLAGATPQRGGISEVQKAWFEEDLRGVPKERHVWILVHQGPYAHPEEKREGHGGSDEVRAAILGGHRIHPIEAVFAGHEHFYERGEIDGIRYFVLGGGGAPLEDPDPRASGVQSAARALSYATVQVCGCHTSGRVKDIAGKVIDAFTLADCSTPCSVPGWAASVLAANVVPAAPPGAGEDDSRRKRRRKRRRASGESGAAAEENPRR